MLSKLSNSQARRALAVMAVAGAALTIAPIGAGSDEGGDEGPLSITLTGVIRDFQVTHPDMEAYPGGGTKDMVNVHLDADGKPTINLDTISAKGGFGAGPQVSSEESFHQWYRDVPGVNTSIPYSIVLERVGGIYRFAKEKPEYFFPIDDQGYGLTYGAPGKPLKWAPDGTHNFHWTYELDTEFTYTDPDERDTPLVFQFTGDDDVWVFINGKLAVDLGGVHSQQQASVNLDDKAEELGLEPGGIYPLKLFFAERHTSESNFRIETTMVLRNAELPTTSNVYD